MNPLIGKGYKTTFIAQKNPLSVTSWCNQLNFFTGAIHAVECRLMVYAITLELKKPIEH